MLTSDFVHLGEIRDQTYQCIWTDTPRQKLNTVTYDKPEGLEQGAHYGVCYSRYSSKPLKY
jgi:hypothetical protein